MAKNGGKSSKRSLGIGIGVAAAAAVAVAGAYFLYGKDGPRNRKKIKGWALKAKGEILEKLEDVKGLNKEKYNQIVDAVTKKYKSVKKLDAKEINELIKEVKGYWTNIQKRIKGPRKANAPKKRKR